MQCSYCNNENIDGTKFCVVCGRALVQPAGNAPQNINPYFSASPPPGAKPQMEYSFPPGNSAPPQASLEKRYKALRFVATCLKVIAFVYAAAFILGAIIFFFAVAANSHRSEDILAGIGVAAGGIILGAVLFLTYYAIAQLIYVFMDIEENTRVTRLMLSKKPF